MPTIIQEPSQKPKVYDKTLPMRRFRRLRLLALTVLLVAVTVTVLVQLRKNAPPEGARLLPGADAFAFIDLQWARRASILAGLPPVRRSPEYDRFVQDSGVDFERDLEQAALAVHYPPTGTEAPPRYSAILTGHINAAQLATYFHRNATSTETEEDVEIYNIPLQGQTLRAAILGPDMVALSNNQDAAVLRGVVIRSRKRASPFGGPSFLRTYYRRVPIASLAWVIARVNPKMVAGAMPQLPIPAGQLLQNPAVVVASARVIRALHVRAEAITASPDEAQGLTEKLTALLTLLRFSEAETPSGGPDADVKAFFDSLKVTQTKDRAILTATMPLGFVQKVFRDPAAESEAGSLTGTTPQQAEKKAAAKAPAAR
jgi:hypothetical protein